jgi:S-DNA-T family DNA segregation ATPase FtsK/SpoIIIE
VEIDLTDKQANVLSGLQRLLETGLILVGVISLYILITLFSFDPADPSWSKTGNYEMVKNAGGAFGAWLADILLFTFGWLAFFVPVAISLFGWLLFRKFHDLIDIDYFALGLRIVGIFLFLIGTATLSSMNFSDIFYFSSGGIIGDVFVSLVIPNFGFVGTTLIMLMFVITGFTLMTGISWVTVIDGIGKYTLALFDFILSAFNRPKKASANVAVPDQITNQIKLDAAASELESTPIQIESSNTNEPIAPLDDVENQQSLLDQFFGQASTADKAEPVQAEQVKAKPKSTSAFDSEPSQNMNDTQAAGMVASNTSSKDVSLDDDMPIAFDDYEAGSYSTVDDSLADDDIKGALESLSSVEKSSPTRTTEAVITPESPKPKAEPITLPSLELLDRPDVQENPISPEELEAVSRLVEAKLLDFNVQATVVGVYPGPVITRFELDLAPGIKVSKITGLSKDLARSLSAMSVRVVEVIPGKSFVGLEIPNKHRQIVRLSEVMASNGFKDSRSPTTMVLGKDIAGKAVVVDLAKMPHLLVAGTTGSGKSVGVNTMILSLLYKATPEEVRLIMIDPKMLELSVYEGIPHLLSEVVTDMKEAANALRWCVGEMERRYKLMSALGVRNLKGFNAKIEKAREEGKPVRDPLWKSTDNMLEMPPELDTLPAIVVVIDEFADMMMIVGKKVEELIARIAQKARAAGIHLVLATQRPSVDVITGLIKANIPTRMAFQVSSKIDSRTILDQQGAENLLGMGDMLYLPPGSGVPTRVHGAFVDDHEVHAVVSDWKSKAKPNYVAEILQGEMTEENMLPGEAAEMAAEEEADPVFDEAVAFVTETRKVSISSIQRKLRIGYNRSARIVEQMEMMGIVSKPEPNGTREVLAPPPVKEELE